MTLCQAKPRKPEFPKLMGKSTPRGHRMSLVDMGPEFQDADARFVLTVDEEITPFADPESAIAGWQEKLHEIVEARNSFAELDYAAP